MNTNPRTGPLMIGRLSALTGVNIETIRYYERAGLLPPPPRTRGGLRAYDEEHVRRLTFIRRSRSLGFPLADIGTLLRLDGSDAQSCERTKAVSLRQLAAVRDKIASLRVLEQALAELTAACRPGRQERCPIIDALTSAPEPAPDQTARAATGRATRRGS